MWTRTGPEPTEDQAMRTPSLVVANAMSGVIVEGYRASTRAFPRRPTDADAVRSVDGGRRLAASEAEGRKMAGPPIGQQAIDRIKAYVGTAGGPSEESKAVVLGAAAVPDHNVGELVERHSPRYVIHPVGKGSSKPPHPAGNSDYHPCRVELFIEQAHLISLQRGWPVPEPLRSANLRTRDLIFGIFAALFGSRVPPVVASFLAWIPFAIFVWWLGFVVWHVEVIATSVIVVFLILTFYPFVFEKLGNWPEGVEGIREKLGYNLATGLADQSLTLKSATAPVAIWKEYHRVRKDQRPAAYVHVVPRADGGLIIQYWLFYYFNHWVNTHDGDWEVSMVFIPPEENGVRPNPTHVFLSSHEGGLWRRWADAERADDTHPIVYVARGSHAQYFEPHPTGYEPDRLVSFAGLRFFKANISLRFGGEHKDKRDWVPSVSPDAARAMPRDPYDLLVVPDNASTLDPRDDEAWNEWWWMRFEGSWSRATELYGPSTRLESWSDPRAWVSVRAAGDAGRFDA